MSQFDYGTIDPNTKSGTQLASDLGEFRDALNTSHSDSSRPTYAVQGTVWLNTLSTPWILYMFDGAQDIALGTINASTDKFIPGASAVTAFEDIKQLADTLSTGVVELATQGEVDGNSGGDNVVTSDVLNAWIGGGAGGGFWTQSGVDLSYTSGNVGVGVAAAAMEPWNALYSVFQLGGNAAMFADVGSGAAKSLYISQNAYWDVANEKYMDTAEASQYVQTLGTHQFNVGASGTADNPITWIPALNIDIAGDVYLQTGSLYLPEIAAGNGVAGFGEIWVKAGAPNTLWWTNEAGTEVQLGMAGTAYWTQTGSDIYYTTGDMSIGRSTFDAWHTTVSVIQIGDNAALIGTVTQATGSASYLVKNLYTDDGTTWKRADADAVSMYKQDSGQHEFLYAASAAADTTATLLTAFFLDNNGSVSGDAIKNDGTMADNSAVHLVTQQSLKTFVEAHSTDATLHYTQAAISITESQISDLQSYALSSHTHNVNNLTDVFNSTPADRHVLVYDGVTDNRYENRLLVEADVSDLQAYILATGVTYEQLDTNSDVGTTAGTLAIGDHLHTGVYEPVDATIIRQADVDDVPVNAATTVPISSNWAFDHNADADIHYSDAPNNSNNYVRFQNTWVIAPTYVFGEYVSGWAANAGTFPTATNQGDWFNVTVAGTVDSQPFIIGDTLIALVASPSTTVYAANWTLVPNVGIDDHTALSNIGTNAHSVIDTHIDSSATIHFTQGAISIPLSQISDITALAAEVNLLDLVGLTAGFVLSADSPTTASWKAAATVAEVNDLGVAVTWANIPIGNVPTGTTGTTVSLGNHTHLKVGVTDFVEADYVHVTGAETIAGAKTFSDIVRCNDTGSSGALQVTDGDDSGATLNKVQIEFGYSNNLQYQHWITTRHNAAAALNAIDFYVSDGTASGVYPTNAVLCMTLESGDVTMPGNLIVSTDPTTDAHVGDRGYNNTLYEPLGTTHLLTAGATDVTATAAEVNLLDLAGLTIGWVLAADSATTASWQAPTGAAEVNDLGVAVTWANIPIGNVPTGITGSTVSLGDHVHTSGLTNYLLVADIDDTPVDAATTVPISSNWAFDHETNHAGALTYLTWEETTRTLTVTASDTVEIGNYNVANGAAAIHLNVTCPSSAFAQSATYIVSAGYSGTGAAWQIAKPISNSGVYSGNEFELLVNQTTNITYFKLRRISGANAGTFYISVGYNSNSTGTWTFTSTTGTEAQPSTVYVGSYSTSLLATGATDVTATAAEVNLLDLAGLTIGWVLAADSATTASWQAPTGAGGEWTVSGTDLLQVTAGITDVYLTEATTDASPLDTILHAQGGSGTDTVGADLTIAGGIGTGTGVGGNVVIQYATAGTTSATPNALLDVATFGYYGQALHATPLNYTNAASILQMGGTCVLSAQKQTNNSAWFEMMNNAVYDATDLRYEYIYTDEASRIRLEHGTIYFDVAVFGAAIGNPISWIRGLTINNSGNMVDTGSITTTNAAGPAILNEAATSTNPTLIPNSTDLGTGVGWATTYQLSLITNSIEALNLTSTAATFSGSVTNEGLYKGNRSDTAGSLPGLELSRGTGDSLILYTKGDGATNVTEANLLIGSSTCLTIVKGGGLYIPELSTRASHKIGHGYIWVQDDNPCRLWYTDDAGIDNILATELFADCSAQTSVNNSTTYATITGMSTTVRASSVYAVDIMLELDQIAAGANIKLGLSGTSFTGAGVWEVRGAAFFEAKNQTIFTSGAAGGVSFTVGVENSVVITFRGYIDTAGTTTASVQFAQLTAVANNTTILPGSWARFRRQ